MNKRQRAILIEFVIVMGVTAVAVAAMINFKDWINRSEAMRAMAQLGEIVRDYRSAHHSVPPESYVEQIKTDLEGQVRLGDLKYRGLWIDVESEPNEVLAYSEKNYHSFWMSDGYIVLRLDGSAEWLGKEQFEALLARQQSHAERQMMGG
ncbi:MAG TPA: hypothetical protein VMX13_17225 [Sedimentisphaerales bacterium]|nr:hypothetical protein [Sedimentisphaerales bacterium]